jgi:Fe-S-cluster containining protein
MSQSAFDYYRQVIDTLDRQTAQLQAEFQEHMACRNGCSNCCKNVQFKISYIEALELTQGFAALSTSQKQAVLANIKQKSPDCPFLFNNSCSVYGNRPALCRAFGLVLKIGDTVGTCELNFNDVQGEQNPITLKTLEMLPYYEFLNDLSVPLWQAAQVKVSDLTAFPLTGRMDASTPPKHSIRDFMGLLLPSDA